METFLGSVLQRSAAEWFHSLQATLAWDENKTHWLMDNIHTTIY